jgi:uncharacterized membrane protein YdjX (TVP38/TMEM64 family)
VGRGVTHPGHPAALIRGHRAVGPGSALALRAERAFWQVTRAGRRSWLIRASLALGAGVLPPALLWWALSAGFQPDELAGWLAPWRRSWYALPLVMAGFVVLALLPVTLLVAATGLAFGPLLGPIYAMAGCLASASAAFAAGRWLTRHGVAGWQHPRILQMLRAMRRNGTLAVFLIRKVPAPFALVNAAIGASPIAYRDFVAGTALGMTALVLALAGFGPQLVDTWRSPSAPSIVRAAALLAVPLTVAWALNRWLRRRGRDDDVPA